MIRLLIVLLPLFFISCENDNNDVEPETGSGSSIIGRWKITAKDRPQNVNIEILDFNIKDSLIILLDTNQDSIIDNKKTYSYQIKPYLSKDAIFLKPFTNEYEWAYPTVNNDTLELEMIRVDTPRIAHYIKIEK